MKALELTAYGNPKDVIRLVDQPEFGPSAADEWVIDMEEVHCSDPGGERLNCHRGFAGQGQYGTSAHHSATPSTTTHPFSSANATSSSDCAFAAA